MAEDAEQHEQSGSGGGGGPGWSQVWHLPVLLLGAGLFLVGVYLSVPQDEGPRFTEALDSAGQYLKANNLDGAEQQLQRIEPRIEEAPQQVQGRFWQYWADLNYQQQRRQSPEPVQTPQAQQTREKIIRYYNRAQKLGHELRPVSLQRKAKTLVAQGETEQALGVVDRLASEEAAPFRRHAILRSLIERHRRQAGESDGLTALIERFKDAVAADPDAERQRAERIWIAAMQAQRHLDAEDPEAALRKLDPQIMRLKAKKEGPDLAPLYVKRAKAYQQMGQLDEAERWYQYAQQQLEAADPLNAEVLVGLGQIALREGGDENEREALSLFSQAVENYPSQKPAYIEALLGQADIEARLGNASRALDLFERTVKRLNEQTRPGDEKRGRAQRVIRSHVTRARESDKPRLALDLLRTLRPLHQHRDELPAELLLELATTHRQIAGRRRAYGTGQTTDPTAAPRGENDPTPEARLLANQEAAIHFGDAGEFFRRHAEAVTVSDNQRHGQSLWQAARSFDRAQRWEDAIDVYSQYIETRPDDPRRLEAIHQLGKALLAAGQFEAAAERFRQLLDDHPQSPHAYDSLVPLARALIAMEQPEDAVARLQQVVDDHPAIRPGSDTYEQALIELGRLYYRLAEDDGDYYPRAIETLDEAVTRYGDSPSGPRLRFLLADAYRQSVDVLAEELAGELSQRKRLALEKERRHRLEEAQKRYNQVINQLEARDREAWSSLEQMYHRNAYFYQADCAFDREQYELAIELYDEAARQFEDHPASLVALVQIVNAHCELGQYQQAGVYNRMALDRLQQMPDDAFDQPGLPMSRQAWEDWLRWTSERNLFSGEDGAEAQQAAAG